jgi:NTP pyrophosphatase (non-canonical NTP hydrolase)
VRFNTDIRRFQDEVCEWSKQNFGDVPYWQQVMGVVEEVGELSHHLLKQAQGIRGTYDEHEAEAKDGVGDIVVFLANLCISRGWDLQEIVEETWNKVKQRDWKKDPNLGGTTTKSTQGKDR